MKTILLIPLLLFTIKVNCQLFKVVEYMQCGENPINLYQDDLRCICSQYYLSVYSYHNADDTRMTLRNFSPIKADSSFISNYEDSEYNNFESYKSEYSNSGKYIIYISPSKYEPRFRRVIIKHESKIYSLLIEEM